MAAAQTKTKRFAALTGLVLAGVIGAGAVVGSDSAADDLTPKASSALSKAGLDGVTVDFDGREAKLSNGSAADLAAAEKIVEDVKGVRWAKVAGSSDDGDGSDDGDDSTALPDPPSLSLIKTADGVNLSGIVANAEVAAKLKAAAEASFGTVTGDLTVDPSVGAAEWLNALPNVLPNVAGVNDLSLSVDGDSLAIGGTLATQDSIDTLTGLVEPAISDLTLDNTVKVDPGALNAEDAVALKAASIYFARGTSTLDAKGAAALDTVADVLKRVKGVELEIGGHAGPSDPVRGKILSDERVASVKDYLVAAGIDAGRLSTKSYGSDPQTTTDAFAEQYRRVDFIVKGN